MRATYCRKSGVEFTHIQDPGRRQWLMRRMEESCNEPDFSPEEKKAILERVAAAELFERFLHTKFLGQKRFSLEGSEALIPLLDAIVESAPEHGVRELVIGMAHRGRLNVLSNILGKSLEAIFSEFEDMRAGREPVRLGRRQVPQGLLQRPPHPLRRSRAPHPDREPLAPRGRGSRGRGALPRQAGAQRRPARQCTPCPC